MEIPSTGHQKGFFVGGLNKPWQKKRGGFFKWWKKSTIKIWVIFSRFFFWEGWVGCLEVFGWCYDKLDVVVSEKNIEEKSF